MLKLGQRFSLIALLVFFTRVMADEPKEPITLPNLYKTPLEYINHIRLNSNLNALKFNKNLEKAAINHAKYCAINKKHGHSQIPNLEHYSGKTTKERAFKFGYSSVFVLENIAYQSDFKKAIDDLTSAIYHRFSILHYRADEIGYGAATSKDGKFSAYAFILGNSKMENFCKSNLTDLGTGSFYVDICKNKNMRILTHKREKFLHLNSSKYFVFPNSKDATTYFSGERPDPMPECKITANPVSIVFNATQNRQVVMKSFEIFKDKEKLKNTHIISQKNDINRKFSEFEFAVFSKEVFDFNQKYRAVFKYFDGTKDREISWNFTTRTPEIPYFVVTKDANLNIKSGVEYEIFLKPKDCNDILTKYSSQHYGEKAQIKPYGVNSLRVKFEGKSGDELKIFTNNGTTITLILISSSLASRMKFRAKIALLGIVVALLGIVVALFVFIKFLMRGKNGKIMGR